MLSVFQAGQVQKRWALSASTVLRGASFEPSCRV